MMIDAIALPTAQTYGPIYLVAPGPGQPYAPPLATGSESGDAWQPIIEQLTGYADLEDDWNGEGAEAPPRSLVATAIALAEMIRKKKIMPAPSRVGTGPDGTVLLEWQERDPASGGVVYFEIEVHEPNGASWMLMAPGKPTKHGEFAGWYACC